MARSPFEILTPRLRLREWTGEQADAMADINRDPEVGRHLHLAGEEVVIAGFSDALRAHWDEHGFGFCAAFERAGGGETFIGLIGTGYPRHVPEVAGRVEVGWRLARSAWGRGLATEGALAFRDDAFARRGLPELISIIDPPNVASARVAEKLGMRVEGQAPHPEPAKEAVDIWQVGRPAGAGVTGGPPRTIAPATEPVAAASREGERPSGHLARATYPAPRAFQRPRGRRRLWAARSLTVRQPT